jgi:ATP-binding cassette subfamily A (ABC1) protein 1
MSKAKHLQTVAGVKPSAYWLSSYGWDIMNYQLPLWIVVILMFALGVDAFTTTEYNVRSATIVIMFLFGPAITGFTVSRVLLPSDSIFNIEPNNPFSLAVRGYISVQVAE